MATTYYGETDRTRGVLTYSTSQTDTQVTLTATTQLQAKSYGYSGYRLNTKFDGTTVATKLGYIPNIYTSWTTSIETSEYSKNYTRTHSAQSVVVKSEYYGEGTGDYYAGGKSGETSVTITIPAKPSYSISYNANGGSGAPSSQTKWYGEPLTLQSGTPTRTNYLFKGWATSSTATTATYSAGGSYTTNAAATLYAVWELNGYTISYNLNGGSGSFADQTKIHGQTLTLRTGSPTKASSSAGSYTITYNANSGSVSPTSATASRTTSYTFSKWNTKQDGSGTNYNSGASYTANAAAVLYAQYTSSTSTASVKLPTPTRSNYTFTGWYTASSGGTKVGDAGANYTPTGTTTLYAHWTGVTYTITYNLNGGSGTFANQTKVYGETLTLRSGSPTKSSTSAGSYTVTYNANGGSVSTASATAARTTSYTFSKWNTKQDGSGSNYYPPDHLTYTANAAATLYAQYTSSTTTAAITSFPTPTRNGYSFAGWFTAASGGTQKNTPFTPTGSTTLYAHWTAGRYTVSADLKGGSGTFNNLEKIQDVPLTLWTSSPTKTDYVFKGWDTSDDATTVVYSAGASYTENRGRTLYAVWQLNYSEPKITNVTAVRSNSSGTAQDDGTYVKVKCNWRTFSSNYNATKIEIHYKKTSASSWTPGYTNDSPGAYSGTLTQTIGGSISTSDTYDIRIRVTDQFGRGSYTTFVSTAFVAFDQGTEGKSLGFGMVASDIDIPTNGRLDVGMNTYWYGTTPMTVTSYGQASANAAFKFSQSSTSAGVSPAFMIPAQIGSWSFGSRTDYDHLYFTYNDGGGETNANTLRFYLSSSEGTKNNTYKILTAAAPVPVANGGTGQTTASDAMNAFINALSEGTSNSTPDDYIITQYAGGGTTNTTYYRRKLSKVFASSISGLTVAQGGTGASTFTSGGLVTGNGTGALTAYTPAWQAWTAGTTAGPKAKIKLGNVDYESAAIPSASESASGIVTTGTQIFRGTKGFGYLQMYGRTSAGAASRYTGDISYYTDAGTKVAESWYDIGDATNISTGQFAWREFSPNSTADPDTTGKHETYLLPAVDVNRDSNETYYFITTKTGYISGGGISNSLSGPAFRLKPSVSTNSGSTTYGPASIWVNAGSDTAVTMNRMYFRLYSPSAASGSTTYTGSFEQFVLPAVDIGRSTNISYDILTTKNTVTVEQGGTGATTFTSGAALIGNGTGAVTTRTIRNTTTVGYCSSGTAIITANTLINYDGRNAASASNLKYYDGGNTIYGSKHMGWKKVSMTFSSNSATTTATGVTTTSVIHAIRANTDGGTGTYNGLGAAGCTTDGTIRVNAAAGASLSSSQNIYLWWSKTASGG